MRACNYVCQTVLAIIIITITAHSHTQAATITVSSTAGFHRDRSLWIVSLSFCFAYSHTHTGTQWCRFLGVVDIKSLRHVLALARTSANSFSNLENALSRPPRRLMEEKLDHKPHPSGKGDESRKGKGCVRGVCVQKQLEKVGHSTMTP